MTTWHAAGTRRGQGAWSREHPADVRLRSLQCAVTRDLRSPLSSCSSLETTRVFTVGLFADTPVSSLPLESDSWTPVGIGTEFVLSPHNLTCGLSPPKRFCPLMAPDVVTSAGDNLPHTVHRVWPGRGS